MADIKILRLDMGADIISEILKSDDKEFILSKDKVVTTANPKTDILNSYNANVGTGVVVPKKKLITE